MTSSRARTCGGNRFDRETRVDGRAVSRRPQAARPGHAEEGAAAELPANIRKAIAGYLESLNELQEPIPPSIHEGIVESVDEFAALL